MTLQIGGGRQCFRWRRKLVLLVSIAFSGSKFCVHALLQTRTATLVPWTDSSQSIGWVREERDPDAQTYTVSIAWDKEPEVVIKLPFLAAGEADSLGSTLWPPAFAGAILGRSPAMRQFVKNKQILELGAGLGLTGWTLAQSAASCRLTDNDQGIVDLLQKLADESLPSGNVQASFLEWRAGQEVEPQDKADLIFGTDIAYYYFLLRPIMDTVQAYKHQDSAICILGQANRESQWELYHNIKDGCYNQLTDEHEKPWSGTTKMLLYKLKMQKWHKAGETGVSSNDEPIEGVIPIAALIHEQAGSELSPLTPHDFIATAAEESKLV